MPDRSIQHPIIRWLVYSHVWMALCAAAQVWWTFMYFSDRDQWRLIAFAFFGTVSAYGFMRLMRAKGALAETVPLFTWFDRNRRWQWMMVVFNGVIAFAIIFPLIGELIGILWWIVPICVLYVLPFGYPTRYFGLRAIPALKVPIVGLVWAVVTVAMPMQVSGVAFSDPASTLLFVQRFLFVMALTIAFDIRDALIDPPALRTVPQLFGDRGARWIAIGMIGVSIIISFIITVMDPISDRIAFHLFPVIGLVLSAVLLHRSDRSRSEMYFGFTIDGMLIVVPVLAWSGMILF